MKRKVTISLGTLYAEDHQRVGTYRTMASRDGGQWVTVAENLPNDALAYRHLVAARQQGYSHVRGQRVLGGGHTETVARWDVGQVVVPV